MIRFIQRLRLARLKRRVNDALMYDALTCRPRAVPTIRRRVSQVGFVAVGVFMFAWIGSLWHDRYPLPDAPTGIVDVTNPPLAEAPDPGVLEGLGIPRAQAQYTVTVRAVGDGTTDDAAAFQAAATSLVDTGGVIWVPPNRTYKISSTVDIRSFFPIYIVSSMGQGRGGSGVAPTRGFIKPGAAVTNGLFRWRAPASSTNYAENGGGGCIKVTFADPDSRAVNIDSCIYLEDANTFLAEDLHAYAIDGSLLRLGNTVACVHRGGNTHSCGDADSPVVDVAGGPNDAQHNSGFAGYYGYSTFFHHSYLGPCMKIAAACGANLTDVYFENDTSTGDQQFSFISCLGRIDASNCSFNALGSSVTKVALAPTNVQASQKIVGSEFTGGGGKAISGDANAQYFLIQNNIFRDAGSDSVVAIDCAGPYTQCQNNLFIACGAINISGTGSTISYNTITSSAETTVGSIIAAWGGTTVMGNVSSDGYGVAKFTWDPADLADGAGETKSAVTLPGVNLGYDYVYVSAPYDLQGITLTAWCNANGTAQARLQNETGGSINLGTNDNWEFRFIRFGPQAP